MDVYRGSGRFFLPSRKTKRAELMEAVIQFLRANEVFALFVIIAFGFVVGKLKVKGFSFDISAVIFVALLFGHYGIQVPKVVQTIGLVLFIFTVGIQAGPGFMDSFRQKGRRYVMLAFLLVVVAFLTSLAVWYLFEVPSDFLTGILCGALTSTPGLSVAIEATHSPLASIGYGVAYPLGVVGVIVFVKLLPKIMRVCQQAVYAQQAEGQEKEHPKLLNRTYLVTHAPVFGKSLQAIGLRTMTGATISRIKKGDDVITPTPETVLEEGDYLQAVGTEESLDKIALLVGQEVESLEKLNEEYSIETLLVTNKYVVNEQLRAVQAQAGQHIVFTRIRRTGIDFSATPSTVLKFGDKVTVSYRKSERDHIYKLLGNSRRALSDTDFFPIALGIVLGVLLGKVELVFGPSFHISLGLTGGVLIMAIILSNLGKTGPILWTMTRPANNLLRQLGLLFFLAGVGTKAGASLVETIASAGLQLVWVGALITFIPMLVTLLLNRVFFRLNLFELFGVLTGGMTSTPGLAACESMSYDESPSQVYATVYPVAMIALLVAVKVLAVL